MRWGMVNGSRMRRRPVSDCRSGASRDRGLTAASQARCRGRGLRRSYRDGQAAKGYKAKASEATINNNEINTAHFKVNFWWSAKSTLAMPTNR